MHEIGIAGIRTHQYVAASIGMSGMAQVTDTLLTMIFIMEIAEPRRWDHLLKTRSSG